MAARRRAQGSPSPALPHIVSSVTEHPAVIKCLTYLDSQQLATYTLVPVDAAGLVSPDEVAAAVTPQTCLVTIMHSNNEVRINAFADDVDV